MIADIVAGKMSFFELIRSVPKGDYFAHVQVSRLSYLIMRKPETLKALPAEIAQAIRDAVGDVDRDTIEKELARKDGKRRCSKTFDTSRGGIQRLSILAIESGF
jgi:hypothetical protein